MIKAVLFDVDGVLIDSFEANLRFYQDFLRPMGFGLSREEFVPMGHLTFIDVIKNVTKLSTEEVRKIWDAESGKVTYHIEDITAVPDLSETIKSLVKKYKLGIVSSRARTGKLFEIRGLAEVEKDFSVVIYFEDTQNHKPDPEPLLLAAKKLTIDPSEIVFIGDQPTDLQAAKDAGMKFIAFGKEKVAGADIWTPEFKNLAHLVSILN